MFLSIVGEKTSNCMIQEQFQHLGKTVWGVFHKVLELPLILHKEKVHYPTKYKPLANRITEETK